MYCASQVACDHSAVGRCYWVRNETDASRRTDVCEGPNDELTLLTSNCPCASAVKRVAASDGGPSFPTRVPSGTLLYEQKGYKTGTRVRASRYGIRSCSGVSLWDSLMFGRVLEY